MFVSNRGRDLVEASSDRLQRALERVPLTAAEAASIGKAAFASDVAEPAGIAPAFHALDHLVLKTAGRVAMTKGRPSIDLEVLRQAVGVWKGHAGRHGDLERSRDNAARALAELRAQALPHKKAQLAAARRRKAFVDALARADAART